MPTMRVWIALQEGSEYRSEPDVTPVPHVLTAQTSWEQGQCAGAPRQPFYWLGSDTPCTSLSLGREGRGLPGEGRKRKQKLPNAFHNALVSTLAGKVSGETLGPLWTGFLRRKSFSLKTTPDQGKAKLLIKNTHIHTQHPAKHRTFKNN